MVLQIGWLVLNHVHKFFPNSIDHNTLSIPQTNRRALLMSQVPFHGHVRPSERETTSKRRRLQQTSSSGKGASGANSLTWGVPETELHSLFLSLQAGCVILKYSGHIRLWRERNYSHPGHPDPCNPPTRSGSLLTLVRHKSGRRQKARGGDTWGRRDYMGQEGGECKGTGTLLYYSKKSEYLPARDKPPPPHILDV